ncbi:O-methyltransferase [Flavobacteriaceae bacterium]|jgi:predicted O-methyltransferase YrrM|nr:O-methyltransferase [Cryomorphaceae bacterium]MDB2366310.1 O-methyltransferase [Flavobacteriaceae bacterium]MBT3685344.1 O-methyltransferase [Cryomorphaceae bacterium]MBT4237198.1 O-methyltransferase [Cryomorphaceae bacterium]MBT4813459.1 O-methyltransferase [Cryomorphaceae bacterium]|tara:strand:+ start:3175 stop:3816 length:642 start_codon:yes stop_codon:yes gene_type:complete
MDFISEKLTEYISENSNTEPEILAKLNEETYQKVLQPRMLSGHIQGRFLSMISKMKSPSCILEIGTYTGYGTLCLAEGLSDGGKIFTIDRNEELLKIQNKYFEMSGKRDKIIQLTGNAKDILENLDESYDIVFIDADKENYIEYFNLVSERLNNNGIIISDNVLWSGKVLNSPSKNDEETNILIEFNKTLNEDERFETVILPLRDGLSVSRLV